MIAARHWAWNGGKAPCRRRPARAGAGTSSKACALLPHRKRSFLFDSMEFVVPGCPSGIAAAYPLTSATDRSQPHFIHSGGGINISRHKAPEAESWRV